jgi:hypothetical protein
MWIWGASGTITGSTEWLLSAFIGGADALWSASILSGGADGRSASSCWIRVDLLILDLEFTLWLRERGPPARLISVGFDEPPENGGGGLSAKDDVELVALLAESRRRGISGAGGKIPIGNLFALDDLRLWCHGGCWRWSWDSRSRAAESTVPTTISNWHEWTNGLFFLRRTVVSTKVNGPSLTSSGVKSCGVEDVWKTDVFGLRSRITSM